MKLTLNESFPGLTFTHLLFKTAIARSSFLLSPPPPPRALINDPKDFVSFIDDFVNMVAP